MKTIQNGKETRSQRQELLVDYGSLTAYERLNNAAALSRAIFTLANESVLIRNSFHWKRDGEAIPETRPAMSMEQVCKERGWRIVERYGDYLAIVAPK